MSSQKRARNRGRSRGQALVEFSLVIPVFLMILFGILDFGFALYSRLTLINATREGAHVAVTQVDNAQGIPFMVEATIQANATGLVFARCTGSLPGTRTCGDVTITTTCVRPSGSCNFSGAMGTLLPGDSVHVTTTYVYHSFFGRFLGQAPLFGTNVTMVVE